MRAVGIFYVFFLYLINVSNAQITFTAFDQPYCGGTVNHTYTFLNYDIGGGGSGTQHCYYVFRDGVVILNVIGGSMGAGQFCRELIFINDSTGFLLAETPNTAYAKKTSDYGQTWQLIGNTAPGYRAFFPISLNYGYLFSSPTSNMLYVARCSDIEPPVSNYIYDYSIYSDEFRWDTIIGPTLCGIDSLNAFFKNDSTFKVDYHFYFYELPVGIEEVETNKAFNIFPNPSSTSITIKASFPFIEGTIIDMQGKIVKSFNSSSIDISQLEQGLYFIRIKDEKGKFHFLKFIKSNE
ncbi:MAG: T9SS type A sorting domain-containing protein [Bacteroidia bacterium]|nr:T9SS type A sorting domain-containing protein [Bacteroidia bacterium]